MFILKKNKTNFDKYEKKWNEFKTQVKRTESPYTEWAMSRPNEMGNNTSEVDPENEMKKNEHWASHLKAMPRTDQFKSNALFRLSFRLISQFTFHVNVFSII